MMVSAPSVRREMILVAFLTAAGAILRCWQFGALGLQHFDEGIYALAGIWVLRPGGVETIDASLIPYAPPGFTLLVGLAYGVLGAADLSAIAVSIACGIATIPVIAWLGRRTFGPGAGAGAAALAALGGPHVAFSRMALTDVPFLLAWLVSLGLGARFLERPGPARAILFGAAVGAAQNLKYNGWLAGAIVALAACVELAAAGAESRRRAGRALAFGVLAAVVAMATYAPWYAFVERHGGYSALLAHHRSYMAGPGSWWTHLRLQLAQVTALSGGRAWGPIAWLAAVAGAAVATGWTPRSDSRREGLRLALGFVCLGVTLQVVTALPWWAALCWLPWLMRSDQSARRLLAVWWLALSILTPFYHPYARLWLPVESAGWLVMGGLAAGALRSEEWLRPNLPRAAFAWPLACLLVAMGLAVLGEPRARPLPGLLAASDSLQRAVDSVVADLPRDVAGLRVLARPPVAFYLAGKVPAQLEPNLAGLLAPGDPHTWALVDSAQIRSEGGPAAAKSRLLARWELVREVPTALNLPTLLDLEPTAVGGTTTSRAAPLWLLRPRRGGR